MSKIKVAAGLVLSGDIPKEKSVCASPFASVGFLESCAFLDL